MALCDEELVGSQDGPEEELLYRLPLLEGREAYLVPHSDHQESEASLPEQVSFMLELLSQAVTVGQEL